MDVLGIGDVHYRTLSRMLVRRRVGMGSLVLRAACSAAALASMRSASSAVPTGTRPTSRPSNGDRTTAVDDGDADEDDADEDDADEDKERRAA